MRGAFFVRLLSVLSLSYMVAGCAASTPAPTSPPLPTPPPPTSIIDLPQPSGESLPTISIISPADGFESRTPIVTFEWIWPTPPEGQQFAVMLWREGNERAVVELTSGGYFYAGDWLQLHGGGPGEFFWQVVLVEMREGQPPLALAEMKPRRFEVASMTVPIPIATAVNLLDSASRAPADTVAFASELVVENVEKVTSIAFAPDGRMFFNQQNGAVRVVADGVLQPDPVITFPVDTDGERGLIGIAIDPNFETNHYIWVSFTGARESEDAFLENQVVRFVEQDGIGSDPQVALSVPLVTDSAGHQIGNLHFGPDDMLYMSMGDNEDRTNAQNPDTIPGKIHRFLPTVPLTAPDDSHLPGNSMVAMGFRNPWSFAFDPEREAIFATDNGAHCDDEVNRVVAGGNYGWHPSYLCDDRILLDANYAYDAPLIFFTPPIVPTGMAFYTGDQIPDWQNDLFFCSFMLGDLLRIQLNEDRTDYTTLTQVDLGEHTCWAAVSDSPDGTLYYASFDAIYHIVAP